MKIDNGKSNKEVINRAVEILTQGGILIAPTETAYGLIADVTNKKAIEKIYKLKGRSFKKFLPLIIGSNCQLRDNFKVKSKEDKLIKKYKGVSFVLPVKNKKIYLLPEQETCAVRVSTNQIIQSIAKKLGRPITATSANKSGENNCYSIKDVLKQIKEEKVDLILDAGKLTKKKPSTIVKVGDDIVHIVRQGEIKIKL